MRLSAQCNDETVDFTEELERVLPRDVPHRDRLIEKAAQHLQLIVAANEYMNLTRITSPREAAIKHIFDCVAPWRYFLGAKSVLDAGTGAGFPGIPLSIVLPGATFILAESTQKKARFVESVVEALGLENVEVRSERAEQIADEDRPSIITARAVAPFHKIVDLFAKSMKRGSKLILYKGPEVEAELAEANHYRVQAHALCRYELPEEMGARTLIGVRA
jgi:16S rRNA (guanine527-N7)-methyltransferase